MKIDAERQWRVDVQGQFYQLDFAVFCQQGRIDVETDGDQWHAQRERIPLDNQRANALATQAWHLLHFNGKQILHELETYCVGEVLKMINRLGGLSEEGLGRRVFYPQAGGLAQQLSLFEKPGSAYEIEEAPWPEIGSEPGDG
ncbi:MAG: DUF559 domain-containing protein [Chloroflexota bacterium]